MEFTFSYLLPRPGAPYLRGDKVSVRKTVYVCYGSFPRSSLERPEAVYDGDHIESSRGREIPRLSGGY